jgi:hypothetical protein
MIIYYSGAAFEPTVTRNENVFVATASILEEDGQVRSLRKLGFFASEHCAMQFAVRAATAFIKATICPCRLCACRLRRARRAQPGESCRDSDQSLRLLQGSRGGRGGFFGSSILTMITSTHSPSGSVWANFSIFSVVIAARERVCPRTGFPLTATIEFSLTMTTSGPCHDPFASWLCRIDFRCKSAG